MRAISDRASDVQGGVTGGSELYVKARVRRLFDLQPHHHRCAAIVSQLAKEWRGVVNGDVRVGKLATRVCERV